MLIDAAVSFLLLKFYLIVVFCIVTRVVPCDLGGCLLLDKNLMSDDEKRNVIQITSSFKSGHSNFIASWRKTRSHFVVCIPFKILCNSYNE